MAAYARRSFSGDAIPTTLTGSINASLLTIPIASNTGWPTGSGGNFFAVLARGTIAEEKILCSASSSNSLTVVSGGRGVDGTTATSHNSGDAVEHCLVAQDADEANQAVAATLGTVAAAGDILVATGAGALARLPIGSTNQAPLVSGGTLVYTTIPVLGANTFTGLQTAPDFAASGLTGATAASRYVGATASGAPASGTFAVGDFVIDQTGDIWVCKTAGTPGTWVSVSPSTTQYGNGLFGDGVDGAITFDGSSTITLAGGATLVPSSNTYTLSRDIFATTISVNSGVTLKTANFRIYAKTSLSNAGTIDNSGASSVGTAAPTADTPGMFSAKVTGKAGGTSTGTTGGTLNTSAAGGSGGGGGGSGTAGTGAAGTGNAGNYWSNLLGGTGGNAGTSGSAGGAGGSLTINPGQGSFRMLPNIALGSNGAAVLAGGTSGGAGAGDGTNSGGGSGSGGGTVLVCAKTITNTGTISANGGGGGTPTTGNCGGGGGGGGGVIVLTGTSVTTGTTSVVGGAGGGHTGAGTSGAAGGAGTVLTEVFT